MLEETADDLVTFARVRIIEATVSALRCAIGTRCVWLPRIHVRGRLLQRGDRGTLRIRRWVALDRGLTIPDVAARAMCGPRPPLRWATRPLRLA